jgi:hypothetical protein
VLPIVKNGNTKRGLYLVSKLVQCVDRRRGKNINDRKKLEWPKLKKRKGEYDNSKHRRIVEKN